MDDAVGPAGSLPATTFRHAALLAWAMVAACLAIIAASAVLEEGERSFPAGAGDWLLAPLALLLAARVISHAPANPVGWLLLAAGVLITTTIAVTVPAGFPASWIRLWIWWPTIGLLTLVLLVQPDGRLPSVRWRPAVALVVTGTLVGTVGWASMTWREPAAFLAGQAVSMGWDIWAARGAGLCLVAGVLLAMAASVVRVRRAEPGRRGPLLWSMLATILFVASAYGSIANVSQTFTLLALVIPAVTVLSVLRHGLYDIDQVLHRSMLNGLLTLVVAAVYTVVVAATADLTPWAAPLTAAAVVVLAVLPLHTRLQRLIDRWLFGQRSEPYELISNLARGIGAAMTPAELLASVVHGVGEGLKVPFVAVRLGLREEPEQEFGRRRAWSVTTMPLEHRGEWIGELAVQQRAPDEPWSRRERTLLADLARQVAPSAAAVRLTRDLQAARERLVTAREEERRRLRSDLHDGVGPTLSGARMQVRACLGRELSPEVTATLTALAEDLSQASAEIRQVIDGLRPPALDRGLAEALQAATRRYDGIDAVRVDLDLAENVNGLPAAVEVATFRVLDEALSNAVRHAEPTTVSVRLSRTDDRLELTVRDDGAGFVVAREDGVGLTSMRERCEELGGQFDLITSPTGTTVRATFPARAQSAGYAPIAAE